MLRHTSLVARPGLRCQIDQDVVEESCSLVGEVLQRMNNIRTTTQLYRDYNKPL